jgi:glycosyltransferase involved in cell wall biosynthesis
MLHVNYGNLYGGVETILVTLARLRQLCPVMEPSFALFEEGRLSQELKATGVPVHILAGARISRPWTVWHVRHRLAEIIKREKFDLVMCHMPWSLAAVGKTARDAGSRVGFWAHGFHSGRNWLERLARRTKPDIAIGNSCFTERGLVNLFPDVPSGVVYPPVAFQSRVEFCERRSIVRQQLGTDDSTVVIIQVSRLEAWKGHRLHLQALSRLKEVHGWVCWMIGGPQRPEEQNYMHLLRTTAAELGVAQRVHFLGQRNDVPELLAAADIFCQPNQEPEPFGIVFVEALSTGLPVITTALGGATEIVDQSCGLLVAPDSPELLADSILQLIESPQMRVRLGRGGHSRAEQLCDPASQMKKLCELSHNLLSCSTR